MVSFVGLPLGPGLVVLEVAPKLGLPGCGLRLCRGLPFGRRTEAIWYQMVQVLISFRADPVVRRWVSGGEGGDGYDT
jgi:hypothetical protein